MEINEILEEKTKNLPLTKEELDFIIASYKKGSLSDAKMVEFMRLVNHFNFTYEETYYLARAIASTTDNLGLANDFDVVVDKHSAGSMSDPTTLVFMSVLAALDVKCVKVLSANYGDFGNSLNRLNSIKGFNAKISVQKLKEIIKNVGMGVFEPKSTITIDQRLYELRRKAKIKSIPLIAASILSKKLESGANVLVFDVKAGEGAMDDDSYGFFSLELAKYLVNAAKFHTNAVAAVVTNLEQPLATSLGRKAEIIEAINALKHYSSSNRLLAVAKELVVETLILCGKARGRADAEAMFDGVILNKRALEKFKEFVIAYGGDYESIFEKQTIIDNVTVSYLASSDEGYLGDIKIKDVTDSFNVLKVGTKDGLDKAASIELLKEEGEKITKGDKLARITYSLDNAAYPKSRKLLYDAFIFSQNKPKNRKLFYKVIV